MDNLELINYKMQNIDKAITEINTKIDKLTDALTKSALEDKDKEKDLILLNKRIVFLEEQSDNQTQINKNLTDRINTLEKAPAENGAKRWQIIVEHCFKTILGVAVLGVLAKIGLN